jgi:hypothetical protein
MFILSNIFVTLTDNHYVSGIINYTIDKHSKIKKAMTKTITFNELRRIKDSLPDGTSHRIADELGVSVETVRNYFGGQNFREGKSCGIHIEPGPDGGIVVLDDTLILERALEILDETRVSAEAAQA